MSWLKEIDFILILTVLSLIVIGLLGIYSAQYNNINPDLYRKQLTWMMIGIPLIFIMQFFSLKSVFNYSYIIYALLVLSLIYVIFFGSVHMGAKRWINLVVIQLQPSEIGKLALVFVLARFYSTRNIDWEKKVPLIYGSIITIIPVFLVFKQPDLGTSLVYIVVYISILFFSGISLFFMLKMFSLLFFIIAFNIGIQFFVTALIIYGLILYKYNKSNINSLLLLGSNIFLGITSSIGWESLRPYQKMRVLTFLNPEKYSREGGWQVIQSKIAIGNGGFIGEGFLEGSQTQLKFLPEGKTDFIFSVIGEEFGFIGITIVLSLFLLMIYRLVKISLNTNNKFYFLIGMGITSIFIYQIFINIGMTIGITPVTGLPLPFLSYGGSSLLFNMIMIGVVLNIGINKRDF